MGAAVKKLGACLLLCVVAVACDSGRPVTGVPATSELERVTGVPASSHEYYQLAWVALPPEYIPWSGSTYHWEVSSTNCAGPQIGCYFTWNFYDVNYNTISVLHGCNGYYLHGSGCNLAIPSSYGTIRARVTVSSAMGTGDSGFSLPRFASNACTPSVTGDDNVYSEGWYNYGVSFTGSTSTNCTSISYSWSGHTGGNGSTSSAYYYICPYTYTAPSQVALTSKGITKIAYKTVTVHGSGSLPCPE